MKRNIVIEIKPVQIMALVSAIILLASFILMALRRISAGTFWIVVFCSAFVAYIILPMAKR